MAVSSLLIAACSSAPTPVAPLPIAQLPDLPEGQLVALEPHVAGPGYRAQLLTYRHRALTLHALVALPTRPAPPGGYPVVVANHGFHPDPPRYGIRRDGSDHRPGDYYGKIPGAFAAAGFAVVMADYRGHNSSQGIAGGPLGARYYAEDVLGLMDTLPELPGINPGQLFMWGHSMGGEVSLRVLLARPEVRAAALWSSTGGSLWDQAHFYGAATVGSAVETDRSPLAAVRTLRDALSQLGEDWDWRATEPLAALQELQTPIALHHARDDTGTLFDWSRRLAAELRRLQKSYVFYRYEGADHLFAGSQFSKALARDLAFFRARLPGRSQLEPVVEPGEHAEGRHEKGQ